MLSFPPQTLPAFTACLSFSNTLFFSYFLTHFSYLSTSYLPLQPHVLAHPGCYSLVTVLSGFLFFCFLFIIYSIFFHLHEQLINLLVPGASHIFPSISVPLSYSSACRSLSTLYTNSFCVCLLCGCVEYKLHRERTSCDIVFLLFAVIDVSSYLAYACCYRDGNRRSISLRWTLITNCVSLYK